MTREAERVLIAHPDTRILLQLCTELAELGCTTWPARDGWEALRSLRYFPADVVVIDGRSRGLDGGEFTCALRNRDETSAIATVVLLDADDSDMFWIAQRCGADCILTTTDPGELRAHIARVVAKRRRTPAAPAMRRLG